MNSKDELYRIDKFAHFRNPVYAPIGYHCDDSCGCAPCRFKWFDSVAEMSDHILNVELPLISWDQEMIDESRATLARLLARVTAEGLTEELRESLNRLDWGVTMHWWGSLEDLLSGRTQFSREILDGYSRSKGGDSVTKTDIVDFVDFLRHCCESDADTDSDSHDDDPSR